MTSEPISAGDVKKGIYILLKEKLCKVKNVTIVKVGKHGHTKAIISASDLFTGKNVNMSHPSGDVLTRFYPTQTVYSLSQVDEDGYCFLISEEGETREDFRVFGKQAEELRKAGEVEVTVLSAGSFEGILKYSR
jgi:translation initiation factor 5A